MSETYPKHLFTYRFEGDEYGFDIPAKSAAEAKARLSAIGMARYDGEIKTDDPGPRRGLASKATRPTPETNR